MSRRLAGLILLGLILTGCSEDKIPPPEIEVFSGELAIHDVLVASDDKVDTVVFTVEGSQYRLEHTTNSSRLCNSGGEVGDFGRPMIRLKPTFFSATGNCDTLRVPQGWFKADFREDSLILGPDTIEFNTPGLADSLLEYIFRLSK